MPFMKNNGKTAALIGMVFIAGVSVFACKETTKETETVVPAPAGDTASSPPSSDTKTTESSTTTTNSTSPMGDSSTTTEKTTTEKKP